MPSYIVSEFSLMSIMSISVQRNLTSRWLAIQKRMSFQPYPQSVETGLSLDVGINYIIFDWLIAGVQSLQDNNTTVALIHPPDHPKADSEMNWDTTDPVTRNPVATIPFAPHYHPQSVCGHTSLQQDQHSQLRLEASPIYSLL